MTLSDKLALVIAGAAALILEVVSMRLTTRALGEGALATTITLSLFLLGLALPPLWLLKARRSPCKKDKALVTGALTLICLPLYMISAASMPQSGFMAAVIVLLPAIACGWILPVFASSNTAQNNQAYALFNTGAALGTAGAGLMLLPALGLKGTTIFCAVLAGLATIVLLVSKQDPPAALDQSVDMTKPDRLDLCLVTLSSFICLISETVLIKIVTSMVGSSVTALALVVSVYITGLALGNRLAIIIKTRSNYNQQIWRPALPLLMVLLLLGVNLGLSYLPELYLQLRSALPAPAGQPLAALLPSVILSILISLPLSTVFGMVFPLCLKGDKKQFGLMLALSTLSSVIAPWLVYAMLAWQWSLVGGSALITLLDLTTALAILLSLIFILRSNFALPQRAAVLVMLGLIAVALLRVDSDNQKDALSSGPVFLPDGKGWQEQRAYEKQYQKRVFYADGLTSTVALLRDDHRQDEILMTSGKIEAVRSKANSPMTRTHKLLALLPAMASNRLDHVLVIGMGLGITSDTFLQMPVKKLTVAEIEAQVIRANQASRLKSADNGAVEMKTLDGRHLLQNDDTRYDIIACQPSEPWVSGAGSLFTREFVELARNRLNHGGVMAQWLQLYGLDRADLLSYIQMFKNVYPDCLIFHQKNAGEIILLGGKTTALQSTLQARLDLPAASKSLLEAGLDQDGLDDSLISVKAIDQLLKQYKGSIAPASTDDNLALQYSAYLPDRGVNVTESTVSINAALLNALKRVSKKPNATEIVDFGHQ